MSKKLILGGLKVLKEQYKPRPSPRIGPPRFPTRGRNPGARMPMAGQMFKGQTPRGTAAGAVDRMGNMMLPSRGGSIKVKPPSRERLLNFGLKKKTAGKVIRGTAITSGLGAGTKGYQEFTDDLTNAIPGVKASPAKVNVLGIGFGGRENQGKVVGAIKDTAFEMEPKEYKALATDPVTTRVILPNVAKDIAKDVTDTATNVGAFVTTGGAGNVAKKVTGAGEKISTKVGDKVKQVLKPKTIEPFLKPRDYESLGQTTKKLSKNVADRFDLDTEKAKEYADTVQDFFKTKTYDL